MPDEEPDGRGRRRRAGKTGRRASRRGDADGGAPEGGGLFGGGDDAGGRSKRRGSSSEEHSSDPEARARGICLRLLTLAPRTRAQLAEALRKKEIPEEVAERVLERYSEVGLIDDQAFAAAWVSSRHHGRGLARRALAQELRHRGVEEETVKEAVEQLDPDEEVETARRLVARKLRSTSGADPRVRTRKLVGMLARKGYSAGLAFRIVKEALEAEGEETEGAEGGYLDSL
ncbi:recombination regulator RecX [Herbidospora mongoliensis]|uniref:recombination regulator RecX n=1 Tax=Herbidospora mongoliensis TaxID=688067 RepID=UPI001C3F21C7|nr:recombination regulator RecX [Herbidospora mongoliensis]